MKNFKLKKGMSTVYPIQIVGLYYPVKNTDKPYSKHYNRDAPIAKHNENAYRFCPYAENTYTITEYRNKEITTEFEAGIYYTLRKNFDLAVFLME